MQKYVILEKKVGETPLVCAENWRAEHPESVDMPLAYAGRLDPMASGKLLILIGDECKKQTEYHGLDKEYEFSVLFGISSDTGDVLGRLATTKEGAPFDKDALVKVVESMIGEITLPYPHFSSKTVQGKPLHTWTLEGRLNEIQIPTITSNIYDLKLKSVISKSRREVVSEALVKIETIPPVTDPRKSIGNDFRRNDIREDWDIIKNSDSLPDTYSIATFRCIASSGTYMRSLAEVIAKRINTSGLAWHIHRTNIGKYSPQEHDWASRY